jgi:3-hydroxyisobutyrate dehydrogenase-like beta-hydroxyacid dehydrogenase
MGEKRNQVAIIGFGEAGQAFAEGCGPALTDCARAYDMKTGIADACDAKRAEYATYAVTGCDVLADALHEATLVLSLVTADQAECVARDAAALIGPGTIFCDMNSIAPDTKRANAALIGAADGHYVDVAVMSPVRPARNHTPLLLSGPKAAEALGMLRALGFTNLRLVEGEVGRASAIKMIRSVMVKGLEALTTECVLAARRAGVYDEVIASLNASWPGTDWGEKADYNLDRMMVHGLRRAAEMEEVVKTLEALGTGASITRATVERQRAVGLMQVNAPPEGLAQKIDLILERTASE